MNIRQSIMEFFKKRERVSYSSTDTFGCSETPPPDCPTFIERDIHRRFRSAISAHNIIVVYGESRQGKTWTIDKYCPKKFRVGCTAAMDLEQIKKEMLRAVNYNVRHVEHSVTQQVSYGTTATTSVGADMLAKAGAQTELGESHTETLTTTYSTVDFSIDADFLEKLSEHARDGYFVFDNFHYLSVATQQQFCSLLKEFNYRSIKIVIVGVWKDASRITAMAPDLVDRCEHIDIGSWTESELQKVVECGEKALNIVMDSNVVELFVKCSANNIGIFKTYLRKYCDKCEVTQTQQKCKRLCDESLANEAINEAVSEAYLPLCDRIRNLAPPKRERSDGRRMRLKIVCAVLSLIVKKDAEYTQNGIPFQDLFNELNDICEQLNESKFDRSNVTQELLQLHQREENRDVEENLLPLFFYDKVNRKLLVIDPSFYQIKAFNQDWLQNICDELVGLQTKQMSLDMAMST